MTAPSAPTRISPTTALVSIAAAFPGAVRRHLRPGFPVRHQTNCTAACRLFPETVTPDPASVRAKGPDALHLGGPPRGLTDLVMDGEFPLSTFYEALEKKMRPVIGSTAGTSGLSDDAGARP